MDIIKLIKNAIDSGKITIGTSSTMKSLKQDSLETVIIASNCPDVTRHEIENASKLGSAKLHIFEGTSVELGATARKPFSIAVLGIKK